MFGIGGTELLVILVVALIVLGPKSLPQIAKTLGRAMGEFRRVSTEFQRTLNVEIELEDHEKRKQDAEEALFGDTSATKKPEQSQEQSPDKSPATEASDTAKPASQDAELSDVAKPARQAQDADSPKNLETVSHDNAEPNNAIQNPVGPNASSQGASGQGLTAQDVSAQDVYGQQTSSQAQAENTEEKEKSQVAPERTTSQS